MGHPIPKDGGRGEERGRKGREGERRGEEVGREERSIQGDFETKVATRHQSLCLLLLLPSIIVTWVKGECSLERGESLVVVLGHPVLMSQKSVSICEGGTDLAVAGKKQNSLHSSMCHLHSTTNTPHSGKLLREKTFANFEVLQLFAKVFTVKFGGVASFGSTSE